MLSSGQLCAMRELSGAGLMEIKHAHDSTVIEDPLLLGYLNASSLAVKVHGSVTPAT